MLVDSLHSRVIVHQDPIKGTAIEITETVSTMGSTAISSTEMEATHIITKIMETIEITGTARVATTKGEMGIIIIKTMAAEAITITTSISITTISTRRKAIGRLSRNLLMTLFQRLIKIKNGNMTSTIK